MHILKREKNGTPSWARTSDLLLRRQLLCPTELLGCKYGFIYYVFLKNISRKKSTIIKNSLIFLEKASKICENAVKRSSLTYKKSTSKKTALHTTKMS